MMLMFISLLERMGVVIMTIMILPMMMMRGDGNYDDKYNSSVKMMRDGKYNDIDNANNNDDGGGL